jgi:hypothetical protein
MLYYSLKIIISAVLILFITEISKKSTLLGAVFASMPLISVLSFIWIYVETKSIEKISSLSINIFWLALPSLTFLILLPVLLKNKMPFIPALLISLFLMVISYFLMNCLLKKIGVQF